MRRLLMLLVLGSTALGGASCYSSGYAVSGYATYATPDLAYVSPGVYVLRDWPEPVFYSNNLYWRYYGGRWYRSPYYNRGWVYARPPLVISRIDRPYAYVRYRPSARYRVDRGRYYRSYDGRTYRRDYPRTYRRDYPRDYRRDYPRYR